MTNRNADIDRIQLNLKMALTNFSKFTGFYPIKMECIYSPVPLTEEDSVECDFKLIPRKKYEEMLVSQMEKD